MESWSDGILSGSYEYDASGRKTKKTVNYGSFEKSFSYSYVNGLKKTFLDSESRRTHIPGTRQAGSRPSISQLARQSAIQEWFSQGLKG